MGQRSPSGGGGPAQNSAQASSPLAPGALSDVSSSRMHAVMVASVSAGAAPVPGVVSVAAARRTRSAAESAMPDRGVRCARLGGGKRRWMWPG